MKTVGREREAVQVVGMPSQLQGLGSPSGAERRSPTVRTMTTGNDDDDQYYMNRMREILIGFPNTGPPSYPVQILDHVYMGNQRNADNVEVLRRYGITHVLNCAGQRRYNDGSRSPYSKDSGIKDFLLISAEDTEDFDIARHFDEAIAFLDRVKRSKGKALVHCNLGVNRSGAFVAAYLMVEQKRTLLEVINYLKVKRFVVLSNKGFRRQLIQFARSQGRLDAIVRNTEAPNDRSYEVSNRSRSEEGRRRTGREALAEVVGGRGAGGRMVGETTDRLGNRERNRGEKLEDFKVTKNGEIATERSSQLVPTPNTKDGIRCSSHSNSDGSSSRQNRPKWLATKTSDTRNGSPMEEPSLRERLWTLPRYMGRGERDRSDRSPTVEVFVSDHGDGPAAAAAAAVARLPSPSPAEDRASSSVEPADARSSSKVAHRQLEPVYETKSCDAVVGNTTTGSGSAAGSSTGSGGRMSAAAESMSAKLSGLLSLLGPRKQPFRSTSYSNVSSSKWPSSSSASLPPPLAAEERANSTSGSLQTSASGSSLSTARPLRVYTRSSTDTEIYRTRQDAKRQTAGRSGPLRLTPRSSRS